jgi:hypothetical protein
MSIQAKAPEPGIHCDPASAQVLLRFFVRVLIFVLFALASHQGFAKALEGLMVLAVLYCIVAASFRRETPFGSALTHYDEAAAYALIARLASGAS